MVYAAASGVGTSLIQLCKLMGIKSIAVASTQDKLDACSNLGADLTINYKELNTAETFAQKVMEFTGNNGVDYILDPICAQNFHQNLSCIAMDCRWVCYGFLGGSKVPPNFDMASLFRKRASLLTTTLRSRSDDYKSQLMTSFTQRCSPAMENGDLKIIIDRAFKMTELAEAMAVVEGNQAIGKIVISNDL